MVDGPHELVILGRKWLRYVDAFLPVTALPAEPATFYGQDFKRVGPPDLNLVPGVVASHKLLAALDAARALAMLWEDGHVHVHADYALLRSMLENAGSAWWLLEEGVSQDDRIVRAYKISRDDLQSARGREERAVKWSVKPEVAARHQSQVNEINRQISSLDRRMRKLGLGNVPAVKKWAAFHHLEEVLLPAERKLAPHNDVAFTWSWGIFSSLAHGSPSSVIGVSDVQVVEGTPVVHVDVQRLFMFAGVVDRLLGTAVQSWFRYTASSPFPPAAPLTSDEAL